MKKLFISFLTFLCATMLFAQTITNEDYSIFADDGANNDHYGTCVSLYTNYAVVGAPEDDNANGVDAGAVYVYVYDPINDEWDPDVKIIASDGDAGDAYGRQVCIYKDDVIIVGAHNNTHSGLTQAGAVYIYRRDTNGVWNETKITADDAAAYDHFGRAVSIWNNYAIVGALDEDSQGSNAGAAYIYEYSGGLWDEMQQIFGISIGAGDNFGQSVAINGTMAVIGAMYDDDNGTNAGAAYVFSYSTSWIEKAKLEASDGAANDWFGNSVSISVTRTFGIDIAISAMMEDQAADNAGAVYVFHHDGTNFVQAQKLVPEEYEAASDLYSVVGIVADFLIVGSYQNNATATDAGMAYLYQFDSGTSTWEVITNNSYLQPSGASSGDWTGRWAALSYDCRAIVGSPMDHNNSLTDAGAAYIFDLPCGSKSDMSEDLSIINTNDESVLNVEIFPNPFVNIISINSDLEIYAINIIDITGKKVKYLSDVSANQTIDLSDLNTGIYIIEIKHSQGSLYQQLIKK
jgi:hypothetical protein